MSGVWDAPDRSPRGHYVTVAYATVVQALRSSVVLTDLSERLAFDHVDNLREATAVTL
ncbi:hypothetical protein ACFY8K_37195 [Streptomyces misionensis]|uniref:hypothetical protein n=1 Tax=Streptomyces misionensis TaxID=67331 RepID=UPI0036787836